MPNLQQLIHTIDRTYRNVYTTADKVEMLDTVQRQIFQVVPKESIPFEFMTQSAVSYYGLPSDCDRQAIKSLTIEDKPGSKNYIELPYISSSSNQEVSVPEFYTLLDGMFMIYPTPTVETENRRILMLYTQRAPQLEVDNLDQVPMLEEDFHELLVLGVCSRMATARGEMEDMNMFDLRYSRLFTDYKKLYGFTQPEYKAINDVMPKSRRHRGIKHSIWAR